MAGDGRGSKSNSSTGNRSSSSNVNGGGVGYFEQMFFGAPVQEYNTIANAEMSKVGSFDKVNK